MVAFLIGAGTAGVVLGVTNRIVFLLPAGLMALVVASVLIVRADMDVGFTALTASIFSAGYLLGVVKAHRGRLSTRHLSATQRDVAGPHWISPGGHQPDSR